MIPLLFDRPEAPAPRWVRWGIFCLTTMLVAGICFGLLLSSTSNWDAIWKYRAVFLQGWLLTILISLGALVCSTLLGIGITLARRSAFLPLRSLALLTIELIRGSPFLVLILFFWFAVAAPLGWNDRLLFGIAILSLFSGVYLAEIFRAGIESVFETQLESARAIGLSTLQTYRFVILPQAIRQILPALAGQFASLIKDSSLLSIIGLSEFTLAAQQVNSATYSGLESFLPLAVGYLLLTLPVSLLSRILESRFKYAN